MEEVQLNLLREMTSSGDRTIRKLMLHDHELDKVSKYSKLVLALFIKSMNLRASCFSTLNANASQADLESTWQYHSGNMNNSLNKIREAINQDMKDLKKVAFPFAKQGFERWVEKNWNTFGQTWPPFIEHLDDYMNRYTQ